MPEDEAPIEVSLNIPALLPADYLADVHHRLIMYKRIASATTSEALKELRVELIDRFGLLPEYTKNLLLLSEIKLRCEGLGIKKLEAGATGGHIVFTRQPKIDPITLIELIQKKPTVYQLDGQEVMRFKCELADPEQRISFVENLLGLLSSPTAS